VKYFKIFTSSENDKFFKGVVMTPTIKKLKGKDEDFTIRKFPILQKLLPRGCLS
jgi:hypothetical protein